MEVHRRGRGRRGAGTIHADAAPHVVRRCGVPERGAACACRRSSAGPPDRDAAGYPHGRSLPRRGSLRYPRSACPPPPRMAVLEDARFREHAGPRGHPERPERLAAVGAAIAARPEPLIRMAPRAADDDELLRVHDASHLGSSPRRRTRADASWTPTPTSDRAARTSRGSPRAAWSISCVRSCAATIDPDSRPCARPATTPRRTARWAFCLFNNVAIAARALQAEEGARARARPRLGRPPRQRHAARLRGGPVGALRLDAPVPVLPGHRRRRRSGPRRAVWERRSTCRCPPAAATPSTSA